MRVDLDAADLTAVEFALTELIDRRKHEIKELEALAAEAPVSTASAIATCHKLMAEDKAALTKIKAVTRCNG